MKNNSKLSALIKVLDQPIENFIDDADDGSLYMNIHSNEMYAVLTEEELQVHKKEDPDIYDIISLITSMGDYLIYKVKGDYEG